MEGGIDDVGIGVLFGLNTYRYDFTDCSCTPSTSKPASASAPHHQRTRICPADDIDTKDFPDAISDEIFRKIVAVIRIAVPYTGMIISTRESRARANRCWKSAFHRSAAARAPASAATLKRRMPSKIPHLT